MDWTYEENKTKSNAIVFILYQRLSCIKSEVGSKHSNIFQMICENAVIKINIFHPITIIFGRLIKGHSRNIPVKFGWYPLVRFWENDFQSFHYITYREMTSAHKMLIFHPITIIFCRLIKGHPRVIHVKFNWYPSLWIWDNSLFTIFGN